MVGKGSNGPPGWKAFFAAATSIRSLDERIALAQPVVAQVQAVLDDHVGQTAGSQKVYSALAISTLITAAAGLDPGNPQSYWQLIALNDVVVGSDRRLALALVEHQFLNSLWRLHEKVANMAHRLSQAVVLVFCSITLRAEGAAGSMDAIAAKPELGELLVAQLTFLAVSPAALLNPAGLATAQRCLQTCWEVTRASTPKCVAFRELLRQTYMAGRALQIAAAALDRGDGAAAAAAADAAVSRVAALEEPDAARPVPASAVSCSMQDDDTFEDRLSLAAQACSFAANLGGLGTRGIELSAAGLAPQRAWLLKSGTLATLRPALEGLIEGLVELRRRIELHGSDAAPSRDGGAVDAEDADLRLQPMPRKKLLLHVEGAVRNLLMLLGLPTIVMGTGEEDVVDSCGFVIQHSFGLFTEGYVDTMRALRTAVADPQAGAAGSPGFTRPYPGDYGSFFRAFAGHIETIAPALGVQLEDWGVRFTGEQAARDLPVMEVGEGVDARIAHSWLKGQIQQIINWGHSMMMIVRMADQAKMAALQQQQHQQQQVTQQQDQQRQNDHQAPTKPAAPQPSSALAAGVHDSRAGAAAGAAQCVTCNAEPQPGGPPLLWCSRCRTVRYCSRACQVGHWPQHKVVCQAAATAAPAAGVAEGATAATSDSAGSGEASAPGRSQSHGHQHQQQEQEQQQAEVESLQVSEVETEAGGPVGDGGTSDGADESGSPATVAAENGCGKESCGKGPPEENATCPVAGPAPASS